MARSPMQRVPNFLINETKQLQKLFGVKTTVTAMGLRDDLLKMGFNTNIIKKVRKKGRNKFEIEI